jgi:basic amino acid/polyamine antiporter, APA family
MAKRKLQRQLSLLQVIMLGTAGTIAAEIFVLTGHAAGIAGPDAVLAIIIGGVLSLSIALNYCELATTYPVTGGAMTYVKEGFGNNVVMFLVGSLDGLSSTFYAALSAVGFAYSLKVFFPFLPIIPVALLVIAAVGVMHVRGITQVGNLQIALGGFLLVVFILYIILGFTRPQGFTWETFQSGRVLFADRSIWANLGRMLTTVALIYNAYVGFEVIADDAEEIREPHRVIPKGILISLGMTTLIYTLVSLVTIGVIPYDALAGSETALTDAARVFWPRIGVTLMAAAGIVATLTSVNSAMLSATREAFTLSRDQVWPRELSRLSRWRTPYAAILMVAVISGMVTIIGLVDFLSFISSAGYMFVLFWASLAMVQLRKKYPDIDRPFKVPLYPLTPILAALSGVLIIAFANPRALLFLGLVIVVLTGIFYVSRFYRRRAVVQAQLDEAVGGGRLLIAAINPKTAVG